jgi:antitoxin VapB
MSFKVIEIKSSKNHQQIDLPKEFSFDDDKVYVKRVGKALYLIPYHEIWKNFKDSLEEFSEDFMQERKQPDLEERAGF